MKRFVQLLSPLIAVVVFSAASWALYKELQNYHWREFRDSLNEIPIRRITAAVLLAALDYTILVGNDWVFQPVSRPTNFAGHAGDRLDRRLRGEP